MKINDTLVDECFQLPETDLEALFEKAYTVSRDNFSDRIAFYSPGMVHYDTEFHSATDPYRFPSISITGNQCALNCEHCHGQLLENMIPAINPEQLWQVCERVANHGGSGCLISGGSTSRGNTPILPYIPTIKRIKRELELEIVVHIGILFPEVAEELIEAEIDGAMLDIIGSRETLAEIYHLDYSVDVFDESMTLLEKNHIPYAPHVVVGLHFGKINGESNAIRMIARHEPDSIVVVAFMPLAGTPMEHVVPPTPIDIARVILAARFSRMNVPVVLGCARPLGENRRIGDVLAIDAGVNGIAYPTERGYEYAMNRGLQPTFYDHCCSLIAKGLKDR